LEFAQGPKYFCWRLKGGRAGGRPTGRWEAGLPLVVLAILICLVGLVMLFVRLKALLGSSFFYNRT